MSPIIKYLEVGGSGAQIVGAGRSGVLWAFPRRSAVAVVSNIRRLFTAGGKRRQPVPGALLPLRSSWPESASATWLPLTAR